MMECALNGFYTQEQRERFLNAIPKRHSVRRFAGEPDPVSGSALAYAASRVCLPGVRIVLGDAPKADALFVSMPFVGGIKGTTRYAAVIVDEFAPESTLYAGISGEALVLEAVSLGLGACWLGAFKRSGVDIPLRQNERVAAIIALGKPAEESSGFRRKELKKLCYGDPSQCPEWALQAAKCVRYAPSAMNFQPWRLNFAGRTMKLLCRRYAGDLDLGIALLHMSLGMGEMAHHISLGQGAEVATLTAEELV